MTGHSSADYLQKWRAENSLTKAQLDGIRSEVDETMRICSELVLSENLTKETRQLAAEQLLKWQRVKNRLEKRIA